MFDVVVYLGGYIYFLQCKKKNASFFAKKLKKKQCPKMFPFFHIVNVFKAGNFYSN
jgi:hypothetical protein